MALALTLSFGVTQSVWAQDKPATAAQKEEPKKEKDPKTVDYERAIKDLKRIDGPFPLYLRRKEILLELSEDQLGKLFLLEATLATGASGMGLQAGDPINDIDVFRWQKQDDTVVLVRPNTKFRWNPNDPLAVASERGFMEAYLTSFRIEQTDPEKKLMLVNITQLFTGDLFKLSDTINMTLGGQYMLDREKTSVDHAKGFKDNTVVSMAMHFTSSHGADGNALMAALGLGGTDQLEDSRSLPLKVSYNLAYRKDDGYVPRLADPRVGYFTTDFFSVGKFMNEDRTERFIQRWNLVKKDPNAALSEPVKPIVWTLDPSIPKKFRPAVRAGILRWNKAFEAIGFKNAVQVQEVPEDDKDYDHADARYNVIRFTMSPDSTYAVAYFRTDPLSGEILNAAVTFDANWLKAGSDEYASLAIPAVQARQRAVEATLRNPNRKVPADQYIWDGPAPEVKNALVSNMAKAGWAKFACRMDGDAYREASFGYNAILAMGMPQQSRDEYIAQLVEENVTHEVGHCMGLTHNFGASTMLSTAQLGDKQLTAQCGLSASIMDYNPANAMAILNGGGYYYTPVIGSYDMWAIKYGYSPIKRTEPSDERYALSRIASQSGDAGHYYQSDENTNTWNPYVVQYDFAKDPLAYSAKAIAVAKKTEKYAITQLPKPGENYGHRTALILGSMARIFREGRMSARFVGGMDGNRNYAGDKNQRATLKPVDPAVQRQAMQLIAKNCLSESSFNLPADVLNNLSMDPNDAAAGRWTAPMRDFVSIQQFSLLASLMSSDTTDRIVENNFKMAGKGYGIDEHFSSILGAVFSEVGANENISALRRDLQRGAITILVTQAGAPSNGVSEDVRMLASDSLRRLSARFGAQSAKSGKLDSMTRLHLRDTKATIDRFLARSIATTR